jgi:hypothetical protein
MKRALARIPAAERVAVKGVELRRVTSTTQFGPTASGYFQREVIPGTGERQDRIEIANTAFEEDVDYDADGSPTKILGQVAQGAPSEGVLSHEVGHAVESVPARQAEEARVRAAIADAGVSEILAAASKAYYDAILTSIAVPPASTAKERKYRKAIIAGQNKLGAISAVIEKSTSAVKAALRSAKTAINSRNAARTALPGDSNYAMPDAEAAQDAWLRAAEALVLPLEAHGRSGAAAETASEAENTANMRVRVSSGKSIRITRRLAEFVALIESNRIDIAHSVLGNHVTSHWPDNPEEAYAELYNLSVTVPEGLAKFDRKGVVATYFASPVGLKGAQRRQAAAWLARHR